MKCILKQFLSQANGEGKKSHILDLFSDIEANVAVKGLNLFNAKLSPKRCWWGPGSQEVGKEGDYT